MFRNALLEARISPLPPQGRLNPGDRVNSGGLVWWVWWAVWSGGFWRRMPPKRACDMVTRLPSHALLGLIFSSMYFHKAAFTYTYAYFLPNQASYIWGCRLRCCDRDKSRFVLASRGHPCRQHQIDYTRTIPPSIARDCYLNLRWTSLSVSARR